MTYLQADRSFGSVANNEILPLACHRSPLAHGRPGAGRPLLAPQQIAFRLKAASTAGSTRQTAVSIPVDYSQVRSLELVEVCLRITHVRWPSCSIDRLQSLRRGADPLRRVPSLAHK